jgi:hypothetical protein
MSKPMTPEQEHEFFARPENQEPQGPPRRREASRLSAMVPVRFPPELLAEVLSQTTVSDLTHIRMILAS